MYQELSAESPIKLIRVGSIHVEELLGEVLHVLTAPLVADPQLPARAIHRSRHLSEQLFPELVDNDTK